MDVIMDLQWIKSILLSLFGKKVTASIHGLRFVYMIWKNVKLDPEVRLVRHFLHEGDVAVDVGANGADWTYRISTIVGRQGHVFAFEADRYYAEATRHALALLHVNNVSLFPFGLSDKKEKLYLRITEENGAHHNGKAFIDKTVSQDNSGYDLIELETLDGLTAKYPLLDIVRFIKCDVEGFELFVFRGAEMIIQKNHPLIILEVGHFERQGYSAMDLYNYFKQFGYTAYSLIQNGTLAMTDDSLHCENSISVNRVLMHQELVASLDQSTVY